MPDDTPAAHPARHEVAVGARTGQAVSEAAAEESAPRTSRWGVLRHKHFRLVWFAAFGSSIGTWMEGVGVQWLMAKLTLAPEWVAAGRPDAALMMGFLGAAQLGPTLLLGIVGGLTADRVNRRTLLMVTQLIMMCVAITLLVCSLAGVLNPFLLLSISLLNGIATAFNIPAWQVLTPRLVPREELTRAIVLNGIQFNLARVIGPGLGGLLMAKYSPDVLFAVNAVSFIGVVLAVSRTPDAPAPPPTGQSPLELTKEAARFVFGNRGPLRVFLAMLLFSMLAAPLLRMLPLMVKTVYKADERAFGVMLAVMGVGAVTGGLALKFVPRWYPKHHFIPLSVMLGGASIAAFASTSSIYLAMFFIFLGGIFWLWSFNSSMAAMQLLVDDRMRGRALSICNTAVFGAMPLGSLAAGLIAVATAGSAESGVGTQVGVGVMGIVLFVAGLVMLVYRTPEVDGIQPGEAGFERRPGLIAGLTASAHRPRRASPEA